MAALHRHLTALTRCFAWISVGCLALAMVVTLADIVLRAATRAVNLVAAEPVGWAVPGVVDLVQLFVMAVAYLAIPFAFMRDAHVSVDLLSARLTARAEKLCRAVGAALACILMALIAEHGLDQALQQMEYGDRSMTLNIPISWYWMPLLAGMVLSVLATAVIAVKETLEAFGARGDV